MPSDVLLVVICQHDRSYANRRVLSAMYGGRFPAILFAVGGSCEIDPDYTTIATLWTPRLTNNLCGCCDPRHDPHPSGRHATHPRLVKIAKYAHANGFESILIVEDDCVLAPGLGPGEIRDRLRRHDALIPPMGFRDRDDYSWVWTNHPTGYPALDAASAGLDPSRMLRNGSHYQKEPLPPVLYTPLFGGFVDALAFRTELLLAMVPNLTQLQDVWHEAAIPTALMNHTARVGLLDGVALWGDDRNKSRDELFAMLDGKDFVHPIKLSYYPDEEILNAYHR